LPTLTRPTLGEDDRAIGALVADLIPTGATLQLGIGSIPDALGEALYEKKDLGIHTEMINDTMMELTEKGVITGAHKTIWPGKMIGAFAYGTKKLYDFLSSNPLVELHPASVVNDPYRIGRNHLMTSINTAIEVDLTGQVVSESIGHHEVSGVGGASDTHVGAQRSEGGQGIIAINSKSKTHSKIVFELKPGAKVSVSRNDVDTIVTEHGVARLKGRSVAERTRSMIAIAHPEFRDELAYKAKQNGYI
jgi:acyl-CoA hydrolase